MIKKYAKMAVADLETSHESGESWVWEWDVCNLQDFGHVTGDTIEEFIEWLLGSNLERVYFHNLGFDFASIFPELVRRGFTEYNKSDLFHDNCYEAKVGSGNNVYSVDLYMVKRNARGRLDNHKITFIDSEKIIPMGVEDIGRELDGDFDKLSIDHLKVRKLPYEKTELEVEYVQRDTEIVARMLREMFDMGLHGSTIGMMAVDFFKRTYKNNGNKIPLDVLFPKLGTDIDELMRPAYYGGLVWINPEFRGKILGHGYSLDENSIYPHKLREYPMPWGHPERFDGIYEEDKDYPLFIQFVTVSCKLKQGCIPCIRSKSGNDDGVSYPDEFVDQDLALAMDDFLALIRYYDFTDGYIIYQGGYKFRALDQSKNPVFQYYVDFWYTIKMENRGVKRLIAKLMLNNLIGKFGSKPEREVKKPHLVDGEVRYKSDGVTMASIMYLPVAIFVNSYARQKTHSVAMLHSELVAYIDTDAIHFISDTMPVDYASLISDNVLGLYKVEREFSRACYKELKKYAEDEDYCLTIKCAGLGREQKSKLTFESFVNGCKIARLIQHNVVGGAILVENLINV